MLDVNQWTTEESNLGKRMMKSGSKGLSNTEKAPPPLIFFFLSFLFVFLSGAFPICRCTLLKSDIRVTNWWTKKKNFTEYQKLVAWLALNPGGFSCKWRHHVPLVLANTWVRTERKASVRPCRGRAHYTHCTHCKHTQLPVDLREARRPWV